MHSKLVFVLALAACGAPADNTPATKPAPAGDITSQCVVNASDAKTSSSGAPSCWISAECVAHPMADPTPGDGNIAMSCEAAQCKCVRSVTATKKDTSEPFTADVACADVETARRLLIVHCLHGAPISP